MDPTLIPASLQPHLEVPVDDAQHADVLVWMIVEVHHQRLGGGGSGAREEGVAHGSGGEAGAGGGGRVAWTWVGRGGAEYIRVERGE